MVRRTHFVYLVSAVYLFDNKSTRILIYVGNFIARAELVMHIVNRSTYLCYHVVVVIQFHNEYPFLKQTKIKSRN